jgi:hypothetical protein
MLTALVIMRTSGEYKRRTMWDDLFIVVKVLTFKDITFWCIICFKRGVVEKEFISRRV